MDGLVVHAEDYYMNQSITIPVRRQHRKRLSAILLTLCVAIFAGPTKSADGPHDKAIEARQAMFRMYSFSSGILGGMVKGIADYDAELAAKMAKNLDALANLDQSAFWPQGSDNSDPENMENRALPKIWETFPEIAEKSEDLKKATAVLAEKAGAGLDELRSAMGGVGQSCKGCHKAFRAPRN